MTVVIDKNISEAIRRVYSPHEYTVYKNPMSVKRSNLHNYDKKKAIE